MRFRGGGIGHQVHESWGRRAVVVEDLAEDGRAAVDPDTNAPSTSATTLTTGEMSDNVPTKKDVEDDPEAVDEELADEETGDDEEL